MHHTQIREPVGNFAFQADFATAENLLFLSEELVVGEIIGAIGNRVVHSVPWASFIIPRDLVAGGKETEEVMGHVKIMFLFR